MFSLRIKQDDKFSSKLLSRGSCRVNSSSPVFYYGKASVSVPFFWESQPGTPIHGKSMLPDLDEGMAYLPPLTPPPSYYSGSLSTMTLAVIRKKKSRPSIFLCAIFSKLKTKKAHMTPSPSRSSASSSSRSSSTLDYSRYRFRVHDLDTAPTTMDCYIARNGMVLRQSWFRPR